MNTIYETEQFSEWLETLHDLKAKMRILARINRARSGNFGDWKGLEHSAIEII